MRLEQIALGGTPVVGFDGANTLGFGPLPLHDFCEKRTQIALGDGPTAAGVGQAALVVPAVKAVSPWAVALTTSVVGAAAGWALDEFSRSMRRRRR